MTLLINIIKINTEDNPDFKCCINNQYLELNVRDDKLTQSTFENGNTIYMIIAVGKECQGDNIFKYEDLEFL